MAQAIRDEGRKVNSNINVTPMVDVMLVLLIIFMVITPMLQNKVVIDMASVVNPIAMPDADKEDAIVVAINRDGQVFLGQNHIPYDEEYRDPRTNQPDPLHFLTSKVEEMMVANPGNKTIFVRADARAEYLAVENAIDAVRSTGIDSVGLLTQKREGNPAGGN
jgi:biopolymer transport protein ExbD/biopolymer transport protein TolR